MLANYYYKHPLLARLLMMKRAGYYLGLYLHFLVAGVSSDYSLEEIDEKEELGEPSKDQAGSGSVKSPDVPLESTDRINSLENDPDSALSLSDGEASPSSKGRSQEGRNTEGK